MASDPVARYQGLADTHRKDYARWIEKAKQPATRERRVRRAVEMVRNGQTRSRSTTVSEP